MNSQISHYLAWVFSTEKDAKDSGFPELLIVLKAAEQVTDVALHGYSFWLKTVNIFQCKTGESARSIDRQYCL